MNSCYTPDWEAYGSLQKFYSEGSLLFTLEAADAAMVSLLSEHARKAKGKQLAKDVFRDGKRKAKFVNTFTRFEDDLPEFIPFNSFQQEYSIDDQPGSSRESVERSLVDFFSQLTKQQRCVLALTTSGLKSTDPAIQSEAGVGARQIRNILAQVQSSIQKCEGTKSIFHTALNVIGFTSQELTTLIESL